jgi:hypothetical protein
MHFPIILLNKKLSGNFIFTCYFFIKITYLGKYCSGNSPPNTPWACQIVDNNLTCIRDITNENSPHKNLANENALYFKIEQSNWNYALIFLGNKLSIIF